MATLRERIGDFIDGGQRRRESEAAYDFLKDEMSRRPWAFSDAALTDRLAEMDSRMLDFLLRQRGQRRLGGVGGRGFYASITEQQRLDTVEWSREAFWSDVVIGRVVEMWTDFGFGQHVAVEPVDPGLKKVWDEFWGARRNGPLLKQRKLHKLSTDLLVDGEYFLSFTADTGEGLPTVRRIPTEDISKIICEEGDKDVPLFYVRPVREAEGYSEIWYPDWQATETQLATAKPPEGSKRADKILEANEEESVPGTMVLTMQIAVNEINGRGWPQFWEAFDWSSAYTMYMRDRLTIAKKNAMFVDKVTHKGGSRAGDEIEARFGSSLSSGGMVDMRPPPAAGSTAIVNAATDYEKLPMDTGAAGAQIDGLMALGMASSGTPLDWLGRPDAMQNRAVADHAGLAFLEQLERYQEYWSDTFVDMVEIVGMLKARSTAGLKMPEKVEAEVTLESPLHLEPDALATQMDAVSGAASLGIIDKPLADRVMQTLIGLSLNSLGIRDVRDVMEAPEGEKPEEGVLELFNSRDGQMQALLSLDVEGDPMGGDGHEPETWLEAIDRKVRILGETRFSDHGDLRRKAARAMEALEALRDRYAKGE